ncbi:lysylphosphatidylglycerol synthase transmembrane domain-containing protein [soil metagenome]
MHHPELNFQPADTAESGDRDLNIEAAPAGLEKMGDEGAGSTVRDQLWRPRTAMSFLLAILILAALVVRSDFRLADISARLRQADIPLLLLAIFVYYVTLFMRSLRWRWMLRISGVGRSGESVLPGPWYLSGVYLISWSINCVVPAKLGDAYRAYRVRRDDSIRYSVGFGTIFAERIFDLAVLVALLVLSGILAFHGSLPGQADVALYIGVAMVAIVSLGLVCMFLFRERILAVLPKRFQAHYTSFQSTLFCVVRRPVVPASIALGVWLLESLRVWLVSESLGAGISVEVAVFVALLSALLTTLPFTPAGLGVVEVAIVTALTFVNVPSDMAASVAVLDRLITYWSLLVIGALVALFMMRWRKRQSGLDPVTGRPVQSTS